MIGFSGILKDVIYMLEGRKCRWSEFDKNERGVVKVIYFGVLKKFWCKIVLI